MKKCSLQRSETQTQCEELTNSDSNQRVEENMKSTEFLINGAGVTDNAGGITGGIGFPMKGACYPSLMTRCNLKIIKKIRKNLQNENLEKFEQSCFGPLLKLNQLNQLRFQGRLMGQLLLHMDMDLSNKERLVFRVHNSSIEFRPSDFYVITWLRCYGTSEPSTPSSSSIHENVFQSRPCLRLKDVKKAFITASRDNEGQGERTLKLALLYFLYGILLPRNGRITKLDMKYLHLVEDLEKFNAFPWGRVAYEFLAKSILSIRGRMDGSKVAIKRFDMHGFTYALQTWMYEVMPSVATYCASRASKLGCLTPGILCWSAMKQKQLRSDYLNKLFALGDNAHLKSKIRMGKWTTPLHRHQLKKRKLKRDKDIMPHTGPTYPRNHPTRKILLERNKSMRIEPDELEAEMLKSDKAIEHYKKTLEDLVPRVDDCTAAEAEEEEINKSLSDGKAQHEDAMSAEVDATCDDSVESGSLKRGSRSLAHSGAAEECSESAVAVQDNQGKESEIRGCSDGEVPKEKMACPSSAAGAGAVIIEISSDDETPDTSKRKRSQPANDVDSSDDESCSDAHMESLVAMLQTESKHQKMDV